MDGSNLRKNEKGVISIIVTMVFIIVVGLIVLGFGEISRNQSRQTLDNQLSTASYYAAHSGIITIINKIISSPNTSNNNCEAPGLSFKSNSNSIITCATWQTNVSELMWDDISVNKSQTAYIPIPKNLPAHTNYILNIHWNNVGSAPSITSSCDGKLYDSSSWSTSKCPNAGVLRLSISPGPSIYCSDRNCLNKSSQTYYLIPKFGAPKTTATFSPLTSPQTEIYYSKDLIFSIKCSTDIPCSWINMRSIYSDSSVTISDSNGGIFVGGQAKIDVTAVSNGVARRVVAQANIAQNTPEGVSDFSIVSTKSLCKNVKVSNTNGSPDGLTFDNFVGYISSTYPLNGPCKSN